MGVIKICVGLSMLFVVVFLFIIPFFYYVSVQPVFECADLHNSWKE